MQYLQHSAKDLDFPTVILRFFDDLGLVSHASPSEESKYPYEQCCGSGIATNLTKLNIITGLWIRIRIRIGSVFNWKRGSGSVFGIRIRIQEGKNDRIRKK
jgi:hypothetical protein